MITFKRFSSNYYCKKFTAADRESENLIEEYPAYVLGFPKHFNSDAIMKDRKLLCDSHEPNSISRKSQLACEEALIRKLEEEQKDESRGKSMRGKDDTRSSLQRHNESTRGTMKRRLQRALIRIMSP